MTRIVAGRARGRRLAVPAGSGLPFNSNMRHVRIPAERADQWARRLNDLLAEFTREPQSGQDTFALVLALYPAQRPALPAETGSQRPPGGAPGDTSDSAPVGARRATDGGRR